MRIDMPASRVRALLLGIACAVLWLLTPLGAVAMAATTLVSDIDEAQKILFTDPINDNVVEDSELLDLFEVDGNVQFEQTTGGRYIETAQYFALPAGVGFRGDDDYIPVPEGPMIRNSRVYLRKIQGVVEMSGNTMRLVRGDLEAYLNWAERSLPDLVRRLRDRFDAALHGTGFGIKARINEVDPTTDLVIPIDSAFGVAGLSDGFLQFMEQERVIFTADAAATTIRDAGSGQSAMITDIDQDYAAPTITVAMGAGLQAALVDNDYIIPGDAVGHDGYDAAGDPKTIMGLLGMVDDGNILAIFQNLDRSVYRLWRSIVIDSGTSFSNNLTDELLTYADDETYVLGGGMPNVIVTSRSGLRSYWHSLKIDRRFIDPRGYTGGKGPVSITLGDRNVELRACRKMPPELCFGLETSSFKRWQVEGFMWDDTTGSIWNRVTDANGRKDAYYSVGNWHCEIGCIAPRHNFRIDALTRALASS